MRKKRLVALRIGISRRGLALLGIRGRLRPHTDILADLAFDLGAGDVPNEIESRLDDILRAAEGTGLPATVVIADDLARFFIVTPPHNAAGLEDIKAAAGMRFRALYGEPIDAWHVEADWSVDKPFLACALPSRLREAVLQVAGTHRLTLVEVAPHFIAAWNTWFAFLKPDAWFGVLHYDTLTLGAITHGDLVSVRTTALPSDGQHGLSWLGQHVAREALRLGLDAPARIQMCGDAAERWTTSDAGPLACERLGAIAHSGPPGAYTPSVALASARVRE